MVGCMDHFQDMCQCNIQNYVCLYRFDLTHLEHISAAVRNRANAQSTWYRKNAEFISNIEKGVGSSLASIKSLCAEGVKISIPEAKIQTLREYIQQAEQWNIRLLGLLPRRQTSRKVICFYSW